MIIRNNNSKCFWIGLIAAWIWIIYTIIFSRITYANYLDGACDATTHFVKVTMASNSEELLSIGIPSTIVFATGIRTFSVSCLPRNDSQVSNTWTLPASCESTHVETLADWKNDGRIKITCRKGTDNAGGKNND